MDAKVLSAYINLSKLNNWKPTINGANEFNKLVKSGYIDNKTFIWK